MSDIPPTAAAAEVPPADPAEQVTLPQPGKVDLPEPPRAATIVLNGSRSEREVELESELETERKTRKDRENRISQLEDENFRLKSIPAAPATPTPAKPKADKWTFFDPED